jgi:hypothetical protein
MCRERGSFLSPYTLEVFLFPLSLHIGGILVASLPTHWRYACFLSPYTLEVYLFPLSLHIGGILVSCVGREETSIPPMCREKGNKNTSNVQGERKQAYL